MNKLLIGAHVSMSMKTNYFLGAVQTAINDGANTLMIYTGPPQNTLRKPVAVMEIAAGQQLALEHGLDVTNFVVHAPYIINLATHDQVKRQFAIEFLIAEIERTAAIGIKKIVLHPGSYVNQTYERAVLYLADSLMQVLNATNSSDVIICLETMAGKGCELGRSFQELAEIIDLANNHPRLGVCLDTCHIHDGGYDLTNHQQVIDEFDHIIGLARLQVLHINDSCNCINAHKDRHANIGYGYIGFNTLLAWIYEPRFAHLPKILETPYLTLVEGTNSPRSISPYQYEISWIKARSWMQNFPKNAKLVYQNTSVTNTPSKT